MLSDKPFNPFARLWKSSLIDQWAKTMWGRNTGYIGQWVHED